MGLVGPGFVGAHHVDAVRRLGFVDVVAICDVTREDAEAKAAALGVPKAYGAVEALAADPDIHIVHVTTPNAQHGHGVRAALAAGKHVLCEKPLAMSSDEAWSLWQAARAAGVVCRDVYRSVLDGVPPGDGPCASAMSTFEDGYRAACVVDAVLDSHRQGGVWTGVRSTR